jgi:hypothetical protein
LSRSLTPVAWRRLVWAGLHYGREGGLATTTARGASPEHAAAGGPARADRAFPESSRMAFSLARDGRGGEAVPAASEIAGRIDGGFHI